MNANWNEILQRDQKLEAKRKSQSVDFCGIGWIYKDSLQCRVSEFSEL